MMLMLIFGTCNTIVMKLQDEIVVSPKDDPSNTSGKDLKFNHPFFQCANMFVGELMCLFAYGIKLAFFKKNTEDEEEENMALSPGGQEAKKTKLKTKINPLYLAIPAMFDICGSTLMLIALTMCAASIY